MKKSSNIYQKIINLFIKHFSNFPTGALNCSLGVGSAVFSEGNSETTHGDDEDLGHAHQDFLNVGMLVKY